MKRSAAGSEEPLVRLPGAPGRLAGRRIEIFRHARSAVMWLRQPLSVLTAGIAGLLLLVAPPTLGAELGDGDDPLSLETHSFVSQGFLKSSSNNYLADSKRGSFEFSEVGINFTKPLTDRLRTGVQLFARKLGSVGAFSAKADWFYLDYRWNDLLGFRAGRIKIPFGLYNEVNDIDSARVPILLPQSVYPISNRDFLLAQTGGELYGYLNLRLAGALEYRLYGGTIYVDLTQTPGSPIQVRKLTTPYLIGGRLMWETPLPGLRLGGSLQVLRLDTNLQIGADTFTVQIPATLWVTSLEYARDRFLLAAEYSQWGLKEESSNQVLSPDKDWAYSERFYGMAAYRVVRWFQPGLYYSGYFVDTSNRHGRAQMQHDLAATLRFDINSHWLVKLEGHYMHGTASVSPADNGNVPRNELQPDWALFLIKTTAYF